MPPPNCTCWPGVGPVDAQPVGVGAPALGVVVGRADAQVEDVALGDGRPPILHLGGGDPAHELVRAVVAEQLEDGLRHQRRIGLQRGELLRVREQGHEPVADKRGRRLVAGDVERDQLRDELVVA